MPLTSYRTLLHDRLWALLEQDDEVTARIDAGNLLNLKTQTGWLKKLFLTGAPAPEMYPRIEIANGRYTHSMYQEGLVLASEMTEWEPDANWPLRRTLEFNIKITTDDLVVDHMNDLEEAVQNAILRGGPSLGFDWVNGYSIDGTQDLDSSGENQTRQRLISKMRIPFVCLFDGQALLNNS